MEIKQYTRPKIEIACENQECNKVFKKMASEVRRTNKRGGKHYCSLSCAGKISGKVKKKGELVKYIRLNNQQDKYTGLREHFRRAKYRNQEVDITLDDLLEQWTKQDGLCPYTGVKLIHPIRIKDEGLIYMASLDRIDSKIGYMKGNIQFISAAANMAKNNMTHEQMIEFCKLIGLKWIQ